MIDYYKAIDTETGQEVSYLREVSNRISPEMSAQDCFVALSFLREELEELWTNGTLDKEGERLRSELYTIRSIFFSDHEKLQYDRKLRQAQRKALEAEKETTTDTSNVTGKKEPNKRTSVRTYEEIRFRFILGETLVSLSAEYGVPLSTLKQKSSAECWGLQKKITDEEKAGTPEILKETRSAEDDFWTADMQTKNTELEKKYGALGIADIVAKKVAEMEKKMESFL